MTGKVPGNHHASAARFFQSAIHKQVKNDLPGAIAAYLAALRLDDTDPWVYWYLGTAYEATGKPDKAELEFQKEQMMKKQPLGGNETVKD